MSEKLYNFNNAFEVEDNSSKRENDEFNPVTRDKDVNDTKNIKENKIDEDNYAPLVTYVSEPPKTSAVFAKTETETKPSGDGSGSSAENGLSRYYGYGTHPVTPPYNTYAIPNQYRWSSHGSTESIQMKDKYNSDEAGNTDSKSGKKSKKRDKREKKKTKNLGLKIFAVAMSAMFLFTSSSTVYYMISSRNATGMENAVNGNTVLFNPRNTDEDLNTVFENTGITINEGKSSKVLTTIEVIEKAKPSVVCIEVKSEVTVDNFSGFFGRGGSSQVYEQQSIGTGFILSEDGYIATNYHVIEGSKELKVTLNSGESYKAQVIGGDEAADIAVIKIDAKNLPVAEFGNSETLIQGEDVVAIGTPAGIEFAGTATKGIISAINRDVDVPVGNGLTSKTMTVIQTDASINPGNSGGPLVNDRGQVIGITTMKLSTEMFEGMGFAIPINIARPVINDIIDNPGIRNVANSVSVVEDTSNVSLGISGSTITQAESQYSGIPQGFKIASIVENGPCHNSGIQVSDIVVGFDGKTVTSYEEVIELKKDYKPGDKVVITVYRNGDTYDFEITLGAR